MELLIIAVLIGLIPAVIAKGKGRSFGLWWFYGAAMFIIALPHALIMNANNEAIERRQLSIFHRWWVGLAIIAVLWVIILVFIGFASEDGAFLYPSASSTKRSTAVPRAKEERSPSASILGIGNTVKTDYFEVTVNSLKFSKSAGSNSFSRISAGDGNHYAILNVTFKNIDTESRMLDSGEVYVDYNGRELRFDSAEIVLEEGYIVFEDLNPLTKITGNVVFTLPEELSSGLTYMPPRSNIKIKIN